MTAIPDTIYLPGQDGSILRTLLYFDIFQYPLTREEIGRFSPAPLSKGWEDSLEDLCRRQHVYRVENFYLLHPNPLLVVRRKAGNLLSARKLKSAVRICKGIQMIPFVRAVLLSGSISKGYMDEQGDIDYFIITAPGRLWIVRAMLAGIRRLFFLNSHKYLCTNFFVDEHHLEIREKNIFTAVETATLLPMTGASAVERFQNANQWCKEFLPNFNHENRLRPGSESLLKKLLEKVVPQSWLQKLDDWLMKVARSHWRKRYGHLLNANDFDIAFRSTPGVSRSHPQFYQKKVLELYAAKISAFEMNHEVIL